MKPPFKYPVRRTGKLLSAGDGGSRRRDVEKHNVRSSAMRGNTPLRWIAEAEARRLRDLAASQHEGMSAALGAGGPEIAPLWRVWLARTISRVPLCPKPSAAREHDRRG